MQIEHLDHLVLTVADINRTMTFYQNVLGMQAEMFQGERWALKYGNQKINLHEKGKEFKPNAFQALPGTADLCFITSTALDEVIQELTHKGIKIESGPIQRTGACGPIHSIYIRDPDLNLIELANY